MKTLDEIKKDLEFEIRVCDKEIENIRNSLQYPRTYSRIFNEGREHELERSKEVYQKILAALEDMKEV